MRLKHTVEFSRVGSMHKTTFSSMTKRTALYLFFQNVLLMSTFSSFLEAREFTDDDGRSISAEIQFLAGLQYGTGLNFGFGAIDTPGETKRVTLSVAAKPKIGLSWKLDALELYSDFSMVAATTTLDGELSGAIARSGDQAVETDSTKLGLRYGVFDFSVGGQEFTVGDGFVIGDGNFNKGGADGQYWIGAFSAWRNSAILRVDTSPIKGDFFWLRTDDDLGDARVAGINLETSEQVSQRGSLGLMYASIFDEEGLSLEGMKVFSIRGADIRVPGIDNLKFFGEYVMERGRSDLTGKKNHGDAWYVEASYQFSDYFLRPSFTYRYSRFSGEKASTDATEEYRGLFFTIFKRDWDTWYQGEVAGEFHLFNQNQVSQMAKVKIFPRSDISLGLWYYSHDLDTPHYFGKVVSDTDWSDEINAAIEYFPAKHVYAYLGFAWARPHQAANEVFGSDDTFVVQTYLSYTYQ
jgi:hypothetical protein